MVLRAVIFDLDDTLIVEEAQARTSLRSTAILLPGADPDRVEEVALTASRAAWRAGPYHRLALDLGIASWEGLWSRFDGCHPYLAGLAAWAPAYRAHAWRAALAQLGVDDLDLASRMADAYEAAQRGAHPLLMAGAADTVHRLASRYRLGLLTNGPADIQRLKLDGTGLGPAFQATIISGQVGVGKPSPEAFRLVLDALDVSAEEAVMVGDSWERDVRGALAAGLGAIWIAGARPTPEPELPVAVVPSIGAAVDALPFETTSEITPGPVAAMGLVDQALGRLARAWGTPPTAPVVHIEHQERAVFQTLGPDGPVVVKVDTSVPKHDKETAVLAAASEAGLPVPKVLHADPSPPAILVLELLAGQSLAQAHPAAWRHAGRLLRRLHDLDPPAEVAQMSWSGRPWVEHLGWWADHECNLLAAHGGVSPPQVRRMQGLLADAFEAMEEPDLRFLHGDCQPNHYFVRNGQAEVTGMIDFGDAVLGDAVYDLAVLTLAHPNRLVAVLDGYQPGPTLAQRIGRLVLPYRLIRRLGSASWMREHGYDDSADLQAAKELSV